MKKIYYEQVYDVIREIPMGKFSTYGSIADYLHLGSARMVGYALRQLQLADDSVPAHRVLNRNGELSGRNAFPTPEMMQARLESEGIQVDNHKVVDYHAHYWHPQELDDI